MAVDSVARGLGANALGTANEALTKAEAASAGVNWRGYVDYYADLPSSPKIGYAYTVRYLGTSGTQPSGMEYVWGKSATTGTTEWVAFGVDYSYLVNLINAAKGVSGTDTLLASAWVNGVQTKIYADLGANDLIEFTPATVADNELAVSAQIFTTASGTTVTFTAANTPTQDISILYFITRGTN